MDSTEPTGFGDTGLGSPEPVGLPTCTSNQGDLPHLLTGTCPELAPSLTKTLQYWDRSLCPLPHLLPPVQTALQASPQAFTQFLLDPSTDPGVISLDPIMTNMLNIMYNYMDGL